MASPFEIALPAPPITFDQSWLARWRSRGADLLIVIGMIWFIPFGILVVGSPIVIALRVIGRGMQMLSDRF